MVRDSREEVSESRLPELPELSCCILEADTTTFGCSSSAAQSQ